MLRKPARLCLSGGGAGGRGGQPPHHSFYARQGVKFLHKRSIITHTTYTHWRFKRHVHDQKRGKRVRWGYARKGALLYRSHPLTKKGKHEGSHTHKLGDEKARAPPHAPPPPPLGPTQLGVGRGRGGEGCVRARVGALRPSPHECGGPAGCPWA